MLTMHRWTQKKDNVRASIDAAALASLKWEPRFGNVGEKCQGSIKYTEKNPLQQFAPNYDLMPKETHE